MDMEVASASEIHSAPYLQSSPSLEDIMKLLRGKTDSQRMAGLFLVAKFCRSDSKEHSISKIYQALEPNFLRRLLLTGMGKGTRCDDADRETYLRLSITVLSAFARDSEIAATREMQEKIPLVLEIMSEESNSFIVEECFEFILLLSIAHEDGVLTLLQSGAMTLLASQFRILQTDSHILELGMKLAQLMISRLPRERVLVEHASELSIMVIVIAKQFALLHDALKFEALHLLSNILSSTYSASLFAVLGSLEEDDWSTHLRVGVMDVLQNRVSPEHKLQALVVAESVITFTGEEWLIGPPKSPGDCKSSADRCVLLVLESSRVEIAVFLNELAYLKHEAGQTSTSNADTFLGKLRNLGVAFALVERIIKLISKLGESEDPNSNSIISEGTFTKIIGGLNETIDVVLDYLQDAKEHGQRKGDDLLASVRIVGSYLAEAPQGCNEKVKKLLGYMLSVEGGDEPSSYYSICFLLPMLCQITMRRDGCKLFASTGAFRAVVGHLSSLIELRDQKIEDAGSIFLACDTILNFLLKTKEIQFSLDDPSFVKLLLALSYWAENMSDPTASMMASSICSLILDSTSEEALLHHSNFNINNLVNLSKFVKRSLVEDLMFEGDGSDDDLRQIVVSGYSRWADRFPSIKKEIER